MKTHKELGLGSQKSDQLYDLGNGSWHGEEIFFPPKHPISSEAHPASYSMGTGGYFLTGKASRARS